MVARWAYLGSMVGILLIATALRVMQVDLTEFRLDEGWAALLAVNWIDGGPLPLTGIATTVQGLRNPPLFIYLIAIPLAIARDPALITVWLGILNVAAIGLTGVVVHRFQGRMPALFTVAAYATGSWAIYFSRKIWPNDAMPLFCVLLTLGLYLAIVEYCGWGLGLAGLGLAGKDRWNRSVRIARWRRKSGRRDSHMGHIRHSQQFATESLLALGWTVPFQRRRAATSQERSG